MNERNSAKVKERPIERKMFNTDIQVRKGAVNRPKDRMKDRPGNRRINKHWHSQ